MPGESFPCNAEVGEEANRINTFQQVRSGFVIVIVSLSTNHNQHPRKRIVSKHFKRSHLTPLPGSDANTNVNFWPFDGKTDNNNQDQDKENDDNNLNVQFFHEGPGVGSTELCPLAKPRYQALAMQSRWEHAVITCLAPTMILRSVEKQMAEQCEEGKAYCWMNCLDGHRQHCPHCLKMITDHNCRHDYHLLYHHCHRTLAWSFSSWRTVCQRYNHLQKPGVSRTMIHNSICTPLPPWHSPPFFLYSTLSPVLIVSLCSMTSLLIELNFNSLIMYVYVQYDKPCCTNDVTEDCESMDQSCAWEQTCK